MPPLTREQLAARRAARRRRALRRDRRAIVSAAIPVIIVGLLALVLGITGGDETAAPLASPVASPEIGSGARPPELVVARAEGVQVHIPVDPRRVTAAAFHAIDDASGVALEPAGVMRIHQSPRRGRAGPETAGLSVGAPAGTRVYAPVDGVIETVSDYMVFGRVEGYEVTITPSTAAAGLTLRVTHLDEPASGPRPSVGTPVRAGLTEIGRVRDFTEVAEQELSQFTADNGNHVDIALVRGEVSLIL